MMGKPAEASQPHPDSIEETRRRLDALLPVHPPTRRDTHNLIGIPGLGRAPKYETRSDAQAEPSWT